jgi:hypothetical protein
VILKRYLICYVRTRYIFPFFTERRAKKLAKLHFACQGRGEHCLYNRTFFTMKTRNPRIWIHLMFLALQVRKSTNVFTFNIHSEEKVIIKIQKGTEAFITC